MFKNYLKITIRNLLKYKGYSSINFFGLAFSMALCMVMLLFVKEQISRDHFHENRDRIYRVISHVQFKSNKMDLATSPKRIGTVLKENYTGIDKLVTMKRLNTVGTAAERAFTVRGLYTEPAFFELFSFQLLHGDPKTALASPNSVVLSFEKAQAFFGDQNPIGQSITLKDAGDFIVTGVVDKQTQRTHLQFDALLPFAALPAAEAQQTQVQEWTSSVFRYFNYFLLEKGAHPEQIERSLSEIAAAHYPETLPGKYAFSLQALTDINLGPNLSNKIGSKAPNELVYAMAALVLIVMLTACFNYVNLTVARALKRSLELGVRRVIGAGRWHIVRQLLSESVFFALASALVAFVLLDWLVPAFNGLSMISENLQIRPEALGGAEIYILFFGFAVAVGVLAGIYPALYLSKARPVAALHGLGSQKRPSALSLRKTLLVVQFALSFIFIAFTLQLQQQVEYMLSEDYGFNREHIINVELQETVSYEIFRNEALKLPEVIEVSATSILPVSGEQESTVFQSRHLEKQVGMHYYAVNENFATN